MYIYINSRNRIFENQDIFMQTNCYLSYNYYSNNGRLYKNKNNNKKNKKYNKIITHK